jgi:hypothetical protein
MSYSIGDIVRFSHPGDESDGRVARVIEVSDFTVYAYKIEFLIKQNGKYDVLHYIKEKELVLVESVGPQFSVGDMVMINKAFEVRVVSDKKCIIADPSDAGAKMWINRKLLEKVDD